VLQNFVMAPAQAATPTTALTESGSGDWSGGGTSAEASVTVWLANGEAASADGAASRETQTTPDLASTASYLKSLSDSLKAETDKLNGDTTENKIAYY
ncbi:hemagglutinin, partial [Mycoplasmopsis synoviae]